MPGSPTVLPAERAKRRQALDREGRRRESERKPTADQDRETWAVYLLERDFYGLPFDGHIHPRSSR